MYSQGVSGENYLRGAQEVDGNGVALVHQCLPGCVLGRWPHIHFQVYPSVATATAAASKLVTSQLVLPQDVCEVVFATEGYATSVTNLAQMLLERDNVFGDGLRPAARDRHRRSGVGVCGEARGRGVGP